jgi:hypothetical protein
MRSRIILAICAFMVAFFFLPVVPIYVRLYYVLPFTNGCYFNGSPVIRIYASPSYATSLLILEGSRAYYGLVFVPNDSRYSFQLAPLGLKPIFCNG